MRKKGAKSVYIIADFSRSVNIFSTSKGENIMPKAKRNNETASTYRAAIYARYSSSGQREESIEGQIRECTDFADRNNIKIVKIYADKAVSGKSTDKRDEFQQMMKDSEKGIFNAVICWKIDRFARNRYDSATHKARLKKNGVRLFYAKESIPEGPEGIILESVMEGYAEYYSENLAQNVKRGNYESALECKTLGHMCLGYQTSPEGKYAINPETAPIIRYIFEEYSQGTSCVDIAAALNEKGCRTLTGGNFAAKGLAKILNNEKYIGIYTYKDTVRIEDGVPAIISRDLWEKCQKILADHRKSPRTGTGNAVGRYIFTGKFFCGSCGHTMVAGTGTSKSGKRYGYYQCSGKCGRKRLKKDEIEQFVISKLDEFLNDDKFINILVEKILEYQSSVFSDGHKSAVMRLTKQKRETEKARDNIFKAIENGIYSESLKNRLDTIESEISNLTALIAEAEANCSILTREQIQLYFQRLREKKTNNTQYKERLIDTFLNSIFLRPDGSMLLIFNYSGNDNTITIQDVESLMCSIFPSPSGPSCKLHF